MERSFSPFEYLHKDLPPFFILVADGDSQGIIDSAVALENELFEVGGEVDSGAIPDRDHFNIVQLIGTQDDLTTRLITLWDLCLVLRSRYWGLAVSKNTGIV